MDNIDGTNGMDSMDNTMEFDQPKPTSGRPDPAAGLSRPRWSGRTKRVVTSVAVSTVLLGSGAAIGVALTSGASASTSGTSPGNAANSSAAATTAASAAVGRCAKLAARMHSHGHPLAATRLLAFCRNPLLRLALVGGEHGQVTFQTAAGPKTIAIERGTIQAIGNSGITVIAKDGTTWMWDYTTSTVVREAHKKVTQSALSTGETVLVLGPVVSGANDARLIRIRAATGS